MNHMSSVVQQDIQRTNRTFDQDVIAKRNIGALDDPVYTANAHILPSGAGMVRRLLIIGACMLCGLLPARGQAAAQQKPLMAEDVFKNVQMLKGIPVNQFMET